jgi:uncharacterized protein YneF (UPF0154 family)
MIIAIKLTIMVALLYGLVLGIRLVKRYRTSSLGSNNQVRVKQC